MLAAGGTLRRVAPAELLGPLRGVTHLQTTPSLFAAVLAASHPLEIEALVLTGEVSKTGTSRNVGCI